MLRRASLLFAACVIALWPGRASADLTAFAGVTPTPNARPAWGFSGGMTLVLVGWEIEYARTADDEDDLAPALRTYMGNVFVQNPVPFNGLTFYATAGAGIYREGFGEAWITGFGTNVGGGVKVDLSGPLGLRLDYRVLSFTGDAVHRTPQRFYVGLNVKF